MSKYVDNNGLLYFWQKIKNTFARASDIPSASTASPLANGTANAGSSSKWSRGDHVHPTDTTRAPLASPTFTGTPKAPTAASGTNTTQIATTAFVKAAIDGKSDTDTTYSLSQDSTDGHIIVLTPSSGQAQQVTIPDSDTTDLTQMSGTLAVNHGGTGVATITGIIKGNGTSVMTAATANDIKTLLGTTAVNRATADAAGNNIADTYAKKTDIAGMYHYMGSVATENLLPTTGQIVGDVYNIEASSSYGAAGANVAWNGTAWDSLGEIFSIESITNAEIDTIVAS